MVERYLWEKEGQLAAHKLLRLQTVLPSPLE